MWRGVWLLQMSVLLSSAAAFNVGSLVLQQRAARFPSPMLRPPCARVGLHSLAAKAEGVFLTARLSVIHNVLCIMYQLIHLQLNLLSLFSHLEKQSQMEL